MQIVIADGAGFVTLGKSGENNATQVQFPVASEWAELFGEGVFQLLVLRPTEATPYAVPVEVVDGSVCWDVSGTDVSIPGIGGCELRYTVGDTLAKSETYVTLTEKAIGGTDGPYPTPWEEWVEQVLQAAADAEESMEAAEAAEAGAEGALSEAEAAKIAAEVAQAGAEIAREDAEAAQEKAETAQDKAETAQTAAERASSSAAQSASSAAGSQASAAISAQSAESSADAAAYSSSAAATASAAAQTAQGKAETAQAAAETAQTAAEASKTAAETAQSKAETAQVAAEASKAAAALSETAAASSATAALASQTAAAGSATSASGSATASAASATAAEAAEDGATAAKTAAETAQAAAEAAQAAAEEAAASFVPDATLTQAGKPADAKAAGDAINGLSEDYQNTSPALYTTYENDAYNTRSLNDVWSAYNTAERYALSFIVKFEPQQNGTPTADNPVPITGTSDPGVRMGKGNLYNGVRLTGRTLSTNGEVTTSSGYQVSDWINVEKIKTLRVSYYNSSGGYRVNRACFYRADKSFISQDTRSNAASSSWKSYTVDVPEGAVYARLANMQTSPNYMVVMGDSIYITMSIPEEAAPVYGGSLDIVKGKLISTMGVIDSYNGETLPGKWVSSMDVYEEGATPTIGAQVVYELEEPLTYDTTPVPVKMYDGGTCAQSVIINPNNRGIYAEYVRNDLLTNDSIDQTMSMSDKAADAKVIGDVIASGGWGSMIAPNNIPAGTYFVAGNVLYISTAAISEGETIAPGTNCTATNIVEALNALNAANT